MSIEIVFQFLISHLDTWLDHPVRHQYKSGHAHIDQSQCYLFDQHLSSLEPLPMQYPRVGVHTPRSHEVLYLLSHTHWTLVGGELKSNGQSPDNSTSVHRMKPPHLNV